ncbi:hypothetical protein NA57DRAFT_80597 [Rhizodiscina lignyota]|uniref:Cyanovirin-N domain-containing protein n=1 Tax=Rhizodiscina lignyota TaxID=1504668 RepID=A0A9P4M117_9PEZI|nr:hypothetical protein NA57DRAFT_80597 [Rhizodiscina lignyota]
MKFLHIASLTAMAAVAYGQGQNVYLNCSGLRTDGVDDVKDIFCGCPGTFDEDTGAIHLTGTCAGRPKKVLNSYDTVTGFWAVGGCPVPRRGSAETIDICCNGELSRGAEQSEGAIGCTLPKQILKTQVPAGAQ